MTKFFLNQNRRIVALAMLGAALICFLPEGMLAAGKASPAAKQEQTQAPGRLLIVRAANLGTVVVGLTIDGRETAKLNFGGSYDAPLAAGPHVVTVVPIPNREHGEPNQTRINVQPGQTYKFTAKLSDVSIVLR